MRTSNRSVHFAGRALAWLFLSLLTAAVPGPPVGTLMTQAATFLKPNGAILVFFPSASQTEELAAVRDDFASAGVGLAAITKAMGGITQPGIVAVDAGGRIKAKYFDQHYTAAAALTHAFSWNPSADREDHAGRHIDLTSSASNAVVCPGDRIALVLDIRLKPQMHVYAPGAEGYIPISWTMPRAPAYELQNADMPAPHLLYLAAIDEKAPVYEGDFRLVRDLTIAEGQPAGELTVEGALKYQACDDRMCYIPETVPLNWTLRVETHNNKASAYGRGGGHP
jgi:hypothetical protein